MKRTILEVLSVLLVLCVFAGCNHNSVPEQNHEPEQNPVGTTIATSITVTADKGTDFGTVSKGESVSKIFTVKLNGYAGSILKVSMPYGFTSPDFETNSAASYNAKTTSFKFTAVYSPVFDGSDSNDIIRVELTESGGFSAMIEVTAAGKNVGLKKPNDPSAITTVTILDKSVTTTLSDRDEDWSPPTYYIGLKEGTEEDVTVRFTSDRYETIPYFATSTGIFSYSYSDLRFPNEPGSNYIDVTVHYDGTEYKNYKGERYTKESTSYFLTFGRAKVKFYTEEA